MKLIKLSQFIALVVFLFAFTLSVKSSIEQINLDSKKDQISHTVTLAGLSSLFASGETGGGEVSCGCAGGPGSSSCACTVAGTGCSVTCQSGYYACCGFTNLGCSCKKS